MNEDADNGAGRETTTRHYFGYDNLRTELPTGIRAERESALAPEAMSDEETNEYNLFERIIIAVLTAIAGASVTLTILVLYSKG